MGREACALCMSGRSAYETRALSLSFCSPITPVPPPRPAMVDGAVQAQSIHDLRVFVRSHQQDYVSSGDECWATAFGSRVYTSVSVGVYTLW